MKYTKKQKEILKNNNADMFLSGSHNVVIVKGEFRIYESKLNNNDFI